METRTPDEIIKASPYGDNAIIEHQDEIVEALVISWNNIVVDFENRALLFALKVKEILKDCPDKTYAEVIEKVRNHPNLKQQAHSKDRIMRYVRLATKEPKVIEYSQMKPEEKELVPVEDVPYLKKDGDVHWEFYLTINRWQIDPGLYEEIKETAKKENWSSGKAYKKVKELLAEKREPNTYRRYKKANYIREFVVLLRDLSLEDMEDLLVIAIAKFDAKLIGYKKWKENQNGDKE